MGRRRRIEARALSEIKLGALGNLSAPNVSDLLKGLHKAGEITWVPSLRTIQEVMRQHSPPDPSGPWSVADALDDDAALVLPVLAAIAERTSGRRSSFTRREAELIAKIRRAAPDLDLIAAFAYAREYMLCKERGVSTDDLDIGLAFSPWKDASAVKRFVQAVGEDVAKEVFFAIPLAAAYGAFPEMFEVIDALTGKVIKPKGVKSR